MGHSLSLVTQSRFYSPALNAAIFDGSIRIYFTQYQEAAALKIYFRLQEVLRKKSEGVEELRRSPQTLYIMLYPTEDSFDLCFSTEHPQTIAEARLEEDIIVGIRGSLTDEAFDQLFEKIPGFLHEMGNFPAEVALPPL